MILVAAGCGYFTSGTWEDDPENWERAFHYSKPNDVVVVHSRFSRFAHWTNEYEYFFQIEPNEKFLDNILSANNLEIIDKKIYQEFFLDPGFNRPAWFLLKDLDHFKVWGYKDFKLNHFLVFLDNEDQSIFLYNRQF
jgi:hypothetical protein